MATVKLLIYGNPDGHAGIKDLLTNQHAEDWDSYDKGYSIFIKPTETIILKNSTDISSKEASRKGVFRIGISIPRGFHLQNTYNLIRELEYQFLNKFTEIAFGNRQFSKLSYDETDFLELYKLINKYQLSPSNSPYRVMNEKGGPAYVSTDQISTLLDDFQYPEFSQFKEIIINSEENPTLNIQVPRAVCYTILTEPTYQITTSCQTISDTRASVSFSVYRGEYYTPVKGTFSVGELKQLPSNDKIMPWGEISLDKEREQIIIRVNHWDKQKITKKVNLIGLKNNDIILSNGKETIQIPANGELNLDREDIDSLWTLYCCNKNIEISNESINFKLFDTVTITGKRKENGSKNQVIPSFKSIRVFGRIINPHDISTDLRCPIYFFSHDDKKIMWVFTISFNKKEEKRRGDEHCWVYEGSVPLLPLFDEATYDIRLNVEESNIHFKRENVSLEGQDIDLGNDLPGDGRRKTIRLYGTIVLCVLCLLFGIAGGSVGYSLYNRSNKESNNDPRVGEYKLKVDSLENVISNYLDSIKNMKATVKESTNPSVQVQISQQEINNLSRKYDLYLSKIKSIDFNFSDIPEINGFLNKEQVKQIILPMKKNQNDKNDPLSLCMVVARNVKKAIDSNQPQAIATSIQEYADNDKHIYIGTDVKNAISHLYYGCIGEDRDNYATKARNCKSYREISEIE